MLTRALLKKPSAVFAMISLVFGGVSYHTVHVEICRDIRIPTTLDTLFYRDLSPSEEEILLLFKNEHITRRSNPLKIDGAALRGDHSAKCRGPAASPLLVSMEDSRIS
jgi:hypothetical protein